MIKSLTTVGNSKAVILPKRLIEKYELEEIELQETPDGILVRSAKDKTLSFHDKLEALRKDKKKIYSQMKSQADDAETRRLYDQTDLDKVDVEILEE